MHILLCMKHTVDYGPCKGFDKSNVKENLELATNVVKDSLGHAEMIFSVKTAILCIK